MESALKRDELAGNHYLLTYVGYLRSIYDLPSIIGGRVYMYGGAEAGGAFNRLRRSNYFIAANAGIVIVTTFGPMHFGGSVGEGGRRKAYLSIGRNFLRFLEYPEANLKAFLLKTKKGQYETWSKANLRRFIKCALKQINTPTDVVSVPVPLTKVLTLV